MHSNNMQSNYKFCSNCGKYGHLKKYCKEPNISIGIIYVNISKNISHNNIKKQLLTNCYDIDFFNYSHISSLNKINIYSDKIKFLMICRKHSLNYVEFIRGKYNINLHSNNLHSNNIHSNIFNMFELMTKKEVNDILTKSFDELWKNLWKETSNYKIYKEEYNKSKDKFYKLLTEENKEKIKKLNLIYDDPEWGFPKGRRNGLESNLDCAIREFKEETNIEINKNSISQIIPFSEVFKGSNNNTYKTIYYLGINDKMNDLEIDVNNNEVSKIEWLNYNDALDKIRPYYFTKKNIISKIMLLLISIDIENNISGLSENKKSQDLLFSHSKKTITNNYLNNYL
jgi:ADP-ribose pyrophosphatase YjhB (NUDIX family)